MATQDGPDVTPPGELRTHSEAMLMAGRGESATFDEPRLDQPFLTGSQRKTWSPYQL